MSLSDKTLNRAEAAQLTFEQTKTLLAEVDRLKAEVTRITRDRDEWKRTCEMFSNAWQRELSRYGIYNKTHLIDALVKTTREIVDKYEEWKTEVATFRERRKQEDIAKTLGWAGPLPIDPLTAL